MRPPWGWPALPLAGLLAALAVALGSGPEFLSWLGAGLAAHWWRALLLAGLYLLPGLALLRLLWPRELPLAPAARLALAVPLSAALPPLLLLLANIGVPWGAAATWGYLLISGAVVVGATIYDVRLTSSTTPIVDRQSSIFSRPGLALLGVTIAALLARLFIVRDLPAGLLGDSYHHTMIAQLLVDNRGLFRSWEPYAPLTSFTYHYGFHANAALAHWLTGADVVTSVVWTGQVINALAAPAVFALVVVGLRGTPWSGVWAAAITGFVLSIPAHYVVWGRYTQLTGQLVLVAAVCCWARLAERGVRSIERPRGVLRASWRLVLLCALVTAAMMLTHYLVTVFAALFAGSYLLALALVRGSWHSLGRLALAGGVAALLALLLASPWLANLVSGTLVRNAAGFTNGQVDAGRIASYASLPPVTPLYAKSYVLLAALGGLLAAGWRREWRMALPALWAVLLVLCVVPQVAGLPGAGAIDNLTGLSALYLALAPLAGYAVASAQAAVARLPTLLLPATRGAGRARVGALIADGAALVALGATVAWGAGWQGRLIDGSTQLVTRADAAAMAWVRGNTPVEAHFLVNAFPAYGGTVVAGSDAGWWLPLLAGRQTTLPPITYGSERGPTPRYEWEVGLLYQDLRGRRLTDTRPVWLDLTTPEALARLREAGVSHVYSGASAVPKPEAADRIDTAKLRESPAFRLVYGQGGVEIFEIVYAGL